MFQGVVCFRVRARARNDYSQGTHKHKNALSVKHVRGQESWLTQNIIGSVL
jgi:hypothetical protein